MPIWKKSEGQTVRVDVLLFDHFSNHCLANAVEPLRAANDLSGETVFEWEFLSLDGAPVVSSSGMEIATHGRLYQHSGDMLFVIPSYGFRTHSDTLSWAGLRMAAQRYGALVGFDTGAWLMAAAGLLDGRRATIHWEELEAFAEAFPEVEAVRERYVMDGDRITCTGAMAAFDLVLALIADLKGEALRQDVSTLFMSEGRDGVAPKDRPVAQAVSLMQAHLEEPLPIGDVARRVGLSHKALEARMKSVLGRDASAGVSPPTDGLGPKAGVGNNAECGRDIGAVWVSGCHCVDAGVSGGVWDESAGAAGVVCAFGA